MRYFFHVTHEAPRVDDNVGVDLPSLKAAWEEATSTCANMIQDIDGALPEGTDWKVEVHDENGPAFVIHFGAQNIGKRQ